MQTNPPLSRTAKIALIMKRRPITRDRLKTLLHYAPETGLFTWRKTRKKCRVGDAAGTTTKTGYVTIGVEGKIYLAHHLACLYMYGELPARGVIIRHKNGKRADNRWENLHLA